MVETALPGKRTSYKPARKHYNWSRKDEIVYQKLHRWSDEDQTVAAGDTEDRADTDEGTRTDDEPGLAIDYRRRITVDDEY